MKWVPMPAKRPYARYGDWFRGELRDWMCDILLSKCCLERGIFNPGFVKQLVADHLAGVNHHTRLGALIAIELWHQQFMD
jgi:asparagine synthase (glutamine-hydrolysing)